MFKALSSRFKMQSGILAVNLRRNRSLQIGIGIILAYLVISLLDIVYPEYIGVRNAFNLLSFTNPRLQSVTVALPSPPSLSHGVLYIFGTTTYRIPILPAILASIPVDLAFAVFIAGISAIIGLFLGTISTYFSKKLELALTSVTSALTSFPLLISVIIFGLLVGFTLQGLIIGITFVLWAYYAQLSRTLTLEVRNSNYIEAARASGASRFKIVYSHIIPNILSQIWVRFSTDLATVIVIFSAANFIFYGDFQSLATLPEFGSLITGFPAFGLKYGYYQQMGYFVPQTAATLLYGGFWWTIFFPTVFLAIIVIGLITFSDGLRKAVDPRTVY